MMKFVEHYIELNKPINIFKITIRHKKIWKKSFWRRYYWEVLEDGLLEESGFGITLRQARNDVYAYLIENEG